MTTCSTYDSDGYLLPIKRPYGELWWMKKGKLHRDEKDKKTGLVLPALITSRSREWYKENHPYREYDLPTKVFIYNNHNEYNWNINYDFLHRNHGRPAVIYTFTRPHKLWYIYNKHVSKEESKNWWAIRVAYVFEGFLDPFALEEFVLRFIDIDAELNPDYEEQLKEHECCDTNTLN